jgi:hypothetical protein
MECPSCEVVGLGLLLTFMFHVYPADHNDLYGLRAPDGSQCLNGGRLAAGRTRHLDACAPLLRTVALKTNGTAGRPGSLEA